MTLDAVVRCKCVFRAEIEEIHALNRHLWQGCQFNLKLDFGNVCDVAKGVICSGVGNKAKYKFERYYSRIYVAQILLSIIITLIFVTLCNGFVSSHPCFIAN